MSKQNSTVEITQASTKLTEKVGQPRLPQMPTSNSLQYKNNLKLPLILCCIPCYTGVFLALASSPSFCNKHVRHLKCTPFSSHLLVVWYVRTDWLDMWLHESMQNWYWHASLKATSCREYNWSMLFSGMLLVWRLEHPIGHIVKRSFTSQKSPKLRDKIRNGKPGFEANHLPGQCTK